MLDKSKLIEHIQQINASARQEWLSRFDLSALRLYLEHLQLTLEPRGSRWERQGETRAVVTRRARI